MKKQIFGIFLLSFVVVSGAVAADEQGMLNLKLKDVVATTLKNSPTLKAQELTADSMGKSSAAAKVRSYPTLSVEGSYRQVSEIGSIDMPTGQKIELGDTKNYSIGPVVKWMIWDSGQIEKNWQSLKSLEEAQKKDLQTAKRQSAFVARMNYFKVQLGLEQQILVADSLKLAQSQYQDILKRKQAGTASQMDLLSSHQEVLNLQRTFTQTQTELSTQIRELLATMAETQNQDFSFPMDQRLAGTKKLVEQKPTMLVKMDSLDETMKNFVSRLKGKNNFQTYPSIVAANLKSQSSKYMSESASAGHWPQLSLQAKSSLDYPNTPKKEEFHQNTVALSLNIPLWEWNRVSNEVQSQQLKASAAEEQKKQLLINLERDWQQIQDQIRILTEQQSFNRQAVKEASELARLVFQSYQAGHNNYLEVERANLQALSARMQETQTNVQLLIQLARLQSLSAEEEF